MIPELEADTRMTTGYQHGRPFPLLLVRVGEHWAESATASAYLEMRAAAERDGLELRIVSAYREHEVQVRLWRERQDPEMRERKGPAARPGWSRHESGRALDLAVGVGLADYHSGKRSPVLLWLEEHAGRYGFARPWPPGHGEPWHWEHLGVAEVRD